MHRREALQRMALLTGGALSFSTVSAVLGGCQTQTGDGYEPSVLVDDLEELVATIAERIIPATDTPGAREAGAHHFIDEVVSDWMVRREREHFVEQLEAFQDRVREEYDRLFVELEEEEQVRLLEEAEELAEGEEEEIVEVELTEAWREERNPDLVIVPGTGQDERIEVQLRPWWHTMKELTLVGYYTSEIGATEELQYEHVPGRWEPCAPLEEIGRTWAS